MKYNININQLALSKTNLDIVDASILDYLFYYCNSKNEKIQKARIIKDKKWWSWVNYQNISTQMPLLRIKSKSAISGRLKKLEDEGFILKHTDNVEQKTYICLTHKIDDLFVSTNETVLQNERNRSSRRTNYNNKSITLNKDIAETSSAPWNLEEKLQKMEEKENSPMDIIATFIREKPVKIENAKQLSAVISRYVRVATKLSGAYTNKQIFGASEKIKEENDKNKRKGQETIDWTLETILKILTK